MLKTNYICSMEIKELRVGNCVFQPYLKTENIVLGLKGDFILTDCVVADGGWVTNTIYEPVPLTEEWLLEIGFKGDGEIYWKGWLKIRKCFNEDKGFEIPEYHDKHVSIKYAHQLQNLYFALTGTELILSS